MGPIRNEKKSNCYSTCGQESNSSILSAISSMIVGNMNRTTKQFIVTVETGYEYAVGEVKDIFLIGRMSKIMNTRRFCMH